MYQYPTETDIAFAIDSGWSEEQAKRGFDIFDFDGTGLLGLEAIYDAHIETEIDDEEASIEAVASGFCKIIPVDELPDPFIIDGINRRWFGWIDTPENRKNIKEWCKNGI